MDAYTIKYKPAPERITSAKQAVEALDRMQQYEGMGRRAFARYMQNGMSTRTSLEAHTKSVAYREVAEEWGDVLRNWLVIQAG